MNGATILHIFAPDTDVLDFAIRHYPDLCAKTNFITGVGKNRRTIKVGDVYAALGPSKAVRFISRSPLSEWM